MSGGSGPQVAVRAPRIADGTRDGPVRPSIPPLLWAVAALWGASALGSALAWAVYATAVPRVWPWALAVGLAAAGLCLGRMPGRVARTGATILVAAALGMSSACLHGAWMLAQGRAAEAAGPREWTGVVVADPASGMSGLRVTVALRGPGARGLFVLTWPADVPPPTYGCRVGFAARLRGADPASPWSRDSFLSGVAGSGKPWRVESGSPEPGLFGMAAAVRQRALAMLSAIGGRGSAVVASAVFGRRDEADEEAFRVVGAAHLLTASGVHLMIVVMLAAWMARVCGGGRLGSAAAGLVAAGMFCLSSGLRTSVLRATVVAVCALVPTLLGRRRSALGGGAAGVGILLLADPPAAFDVAVWIGVAASVGVSLFGSPSTSG